jgi:hypothetical protein
MTIGMIRGRSIAVGSVALVCILSCVASQPIAKTTRAGAASGAPGDAGLAAADAKVEKPFAKTPAEAQTLIQEQIDAHLKPLWRCVEQLRAAKGDPHKPVAVDIGIDQEGNLIGVTAANAKQGDLDLTTRDCMLAALHGLPFPRSHSGVISVRQTFTDELIQP